MTPDEFAQWLLDLHEMAKRTDDLPYPLRVEVWAAPHGKQFRMARLGNVHEPELDIWPADAEDRRIDQALRMLDLPDKGLHHYTKGIHDSDCRACEIRRILRGIFPPVLLT